MGNKSFYDAWLQHTNQKSRLIDILKNEIPKSGLKENKQTVKNILDVGCNDGSVSLKLMDILKNNGICFQYTGLEPEKAWLDKFKNSATGGRITNISFLESSFEDFEFDCLYDLVLAAYSLYHFQNVKAILKKTILGSKQFYIAHGKSDNPVRKIFPELVKEGIKPMTTYNDIVNGLNSLKEDGLKFKWRVIEYKSETDVRQCSDPSSRDGQDLITFFLRQYNEIPENEKLFVHNAFKEIVGPSLIQKEAFIIISNEPKNYLF